MLRSEKPFSVVFPEFIKWLATTTSHVSDATSIPHYPGNIVTSKLVMYFTYNIIVLVAHNGFAFDFPILLAEVERRPQQLVITDFEAKSIHFSDTLPVLRKVSILKLLLFKIPTL